MPMGRKTWVTNTVAKEQEHTKFMKYAKYGYYYLADNHNMYHGKVTTVHAILFIVMTLICAFDLSGLCEWEHEVPKIHNHSWIIQHTTLHSVSFWLINN